VLGSAQRNVRENERRSGQGREPRSAELRQWASDRRSGLVKEPPTVQLASQNGREGESDHLNVRGNGGQSGHASEIEMVAGG